MADWWPSEEEYTPGINKQKWLEMLKNTEIFDLDSLAIMKRMLDYGGSAACKELSQKYGKTVAFYNFGSVKLAKRILKETNCSLFPNEKTGKSRLWPILYQGADKKTDNLFIWRLRNELWEALEEMDLSNIPLYSELAEESSIEADDLTEWWPSEEEYTPDIDKQKWLEMLRNPDIFNLDSLVIMKRILDYGGAATCKQLSQKYGEHDAFYYYGSVNLGIRIHKETNCSVLSKGKEAKKILSILYQSKYPDKKRSGFLIWKLRSDLKKTLEAIDLSNIPLYSQKDANGTSENDDLLPLYTEANFLEDVFISKESYNTLKKLLERKKNVILTGPPGVGKTYAAKRLAFSIMGLKDEGRVKMVQFHQSYSYEDFVMGYRPNAKGGFDLVEGPFYQFCKQAADDADRQYFFIIDEINRGNLSKIFGELLMLIEGDKRGRSFSIDLLYRKDKDFSVPENLCIIGMMNTADRSLAMMDYALRRRFAFFNMEPAFKSEGFKKYQSGVQNAKFDSLIATVERLNEAIEEDKSLGKGFRIGHSYFYTDEVVTDEWLYSVIKFELIPLLEEYWFDEPSKVKEWSHQLMRHCEAQ